MKKWLRRLLQGVLLMIMAFSVVEIGTYLWQRQHSNSQLNHVNRELEDLIQISADASTHSADEAVDVEHVDYTALMKRLLAMNGDTVAYISIRGSENRYPVLQSKDNDFYLRRGIDKKYSIQGIPFMDYQNSPDLSDQNTIIYGHMMYYGDEMFGVLKHFLDQGYADKSEKLFSLLNQNGIYTYRIFAIRQKLATDPYRYPNLEEKKFAANLQDDLKNSEVNMQWKGSLTAKDRIVTLSTCTTNQDDTKRVVVVGVLVQVDTKERTVTRQEVLKDAAQGDWSKALKTPTETEASEQ